MGVALGAIADDGDLLAVEVAQVAVLSHIYIFAMIKHSVNDRHGILLKWGNQQNMIGLSCEDGKLLSSAPERGSLQGV